MFFRSPWFKTLPFFWSLPMKLVLDESLSREATTWVLNAPNCQVPCYQKALEVAKQKNVAIGLHIGSRQIVIQFDQIKTKQRAMQVFKMILCKGGGVDQCVETISVMDKFHAETLGLVSEYRDRAEDDLITWTPLLSKTILTQVTMSWWSRRLSRPLKRQSWM